MKKITIISALFFYSCSPALYVNRLDSGTEFPTIAKKSVKIFLEQNELPTEYEKVAIIDFKDARNDTDIYTIMREKAADLGANGIIKIEEGKSGTISLGRSLVSGFEFGEKRNFKFLAIRFKENGVYPKHVKKETDDTY